MAVDPYAAGLFSGNPYAEKRPVKGRIVVILAASMSNRQLQLIKPISRALCKNQVHELIATTEDAGPGKTVNDIAYLAFFEVKQGGVIVAGDELIVNGKCIGAIAGYDDTHMPNHQNIIVRTPEKMDGKQLGLCLEQEVVIRTKKD